jgi:phage tail protein X
LMSRDMTAMEATSLRFWGVMSLASLVGFALAYPVNVWLVASGLKHGMGTVRAIGRGGHGLAAEERLIKRTTGEIPAPDASTARHAMKGM